MMSNTLTPVARGGLIRGYADGGQVNPVPEPMHKPLVPQLRALSLQDVINALPKGVLGNQTQQPQQQLSPDQQRLQDMQGQANFYDHATGGMIRPIPMPMSKMPERRFAVGGQVPMGAPLPQTPMASPPAVMAAPPQGMPPQGMLPRPAGMPLQGAAPQQQPNPMAQCEGIPDGT